MFLDVPGAGVEGEGDGAGEGEGAEEAEEEEGKGGVDEDRWEIGEGETEGADGEGKGEKLAEGVGDEEEGEGDDGGGGGAEVEEDVEGAGEHAEEEADEPHAQGEGGHVGVVDVGDGRTDLGERAVLVVDGVEVEFHSVGLGGVGQGGREGERRTLWRTHGPHRPAGGRGTSCAGAGDMQALDAGGCLGAQMQTHPRRCFQCRFPRSERP